MSINIKTNKPWQKHSSYTPHKVHGSYYDEQIKNRRKKIIRIIYVIIFILLAQSIFQAPFLALSNIELSGNSFYKEDDIKPYVQNILNKRRILIFQNNNFFLFDGDDLKQQLITQYNLSDVKITKVFPKKIKINFIEKTSEFIWRKNDNLYLLDAKGQFNGQINAINDQYIILDDHRSYQPQNNENIFRPDEIDLIQVIIAMWSDKLSNMAKIKAISIGDDWSYFEITTNLPYIVKINSQSQLGEQLENYYQVLIAGNIVGTDINYIDLRYGAKAYFQ